jgi:transcriptional regulator with XRE-family HTH domain
VNERSDYLPTRAKVAKSTITAQEENPLRQWRLRQPPEGWNRSVVARQLGVSHTAVGSWETGKRLPLVDAFAKIEELTGISAREWMAWYNRRPKAE